MSDTVTFHQCSWAPGAPEVQERCERPATGGIRFILRPAEAAAARHGIQSMLSFIVDLPVCGLCWVQATPHKVLSDELRRALGRQAQALSGKNIPVDWSRTTVEHVPMDHPEYVALRKSQERAENDSQPAPAGPQQEAGDGAGTGGT